jgi:hypothetical protein
MRIEPRFAHDIDHACGFVRFRLSFGRVSGIKKFVLRRRPGLRRASALLDAPVVADTIISKRAFRLIRDPVTGGVIVSLAKMLAAAWRKSSADSQSPAPHQGRAKRPIGARAVDGASIQWTRTCAN